MNQSIPPISSSPPPLPEENKTPVSKEKTYEDVIYPDPFPGLGMTAEEKKRFWSAFEQDIGKSVQKNLENSRKALEELKKSETGEED